MNRDQKLNLLLEREDAAALQVQLQGANPTAYANYAHPVPVASFTIVASPPKSAAADSAPARRDPPGPGSQREVLRTQLITVMLQKLAHQRQLLILSPRHGGARTLVRQMVARSDFAADAITRLSPSALAKTPADYFAALTGEPGVQTALGYDTWQRRRLRPGGERHLIVLQHDGGEGALLGELAEVLRGCQQDPRVHILVAGEARAAALKYGVADNSYFSGMPDQRVPELQPGELRALLACDEPTAAIVHRATGGHPAFVRTAVSAAGPLNEEALTAHLMRAPEVRDILARRLREEDRQQVRGKRHAATVLQKLLENQPVRVLEELGHDLRFPEVRLYFDGMLRSGVDGATEFRCAAVRQAAAVALRNWQEVQE
jgi:hypothetical protein